MRSSLNLRRRVPLALLLSAAFPAAVFAAEAPDVAAAQSVPDSAQAAPPSADVPDDADDSAIVVTAPRIKGSVETDVPPELVLEESAIQSYGASNLTDLVSALSTQTRSGNSRGGGMPIILLGGRRISNFGELRDLPPEAVQRVEVFREEVAVAYGYSPDQRVVNIILKENFSAVTAEVERGGPTGGGYAESELQTTYIKLNNNQRLNLSAQYDRDSALTEAERDILRDGVQDQAFRTLRSSNESLQLNGTLARQLTDRVWGTLNLRYDIADTEGLLGLPLIAPGTDPLVRDGRTRALRIGTTFDGNLGRWRWTLTGNHDISRSRSFTDRDTLAGNTDEARSKTTTTNAIYSINGPLLELPAGQVNANFRAGFDLLRFESEAVRLGTPSATSLARDEANGRVNIDIPLASRNRGVATALGNLSINGNLGYRDLDDFGGLLNYGYGLNWSPVQGLNLMASVQREEAAPSVSQLGDAIVVTQNVTVYDFVRGETAQVTLLTGGNPALRAEERRDLKIGLNYSPPKIDNLNLSVNYFRNRSLDPIAGFPALTADVEAAFPGRIVRDGTGRLVSVDQRSINYLASRNDGLRWGVNFFKQFGMPQGRGPGAGGGPGGGGGPRGPGGRGGGGGPMMMMGGAPQGGRWNIGLFHTVRFTDEVILAPGTAPLDLLNGDVVGGSGGSARHQFDLDAGWFNKGIGVRVTAAWQSGTDVKGSPIPGGGVSPDLEFSSLFTVGFRLFVDFNQRTQLVKDIPFLKGARLAFRVNNLFDEIQTVRDSTGVTPLRYQPGYVDADGRNFQISFRKLF